MFVGDIFWGIKAILPDFINSNQSIQSQLPQIGDSYIIPIVAPLSSVAITYFGIVLYDFIKEQQDKKYLKSTFGAYISPDLIDQMYEDKQEPKLGGQAGYHTAFFSDIQSFSSFSEATHRTERPTQTQHNHTHIHNPSHHNLAYTCRRGKQKRRMKRGSWEK